MNFLLRGAPLLGFGLILLLSGAETEAALPGVPSRPLLVAVESHPPFLIKGRDGSEWSGITVDLWRRIASDLNLPYRFVEVPGGTALARLAIGQADVALPPYPLSVENEELVDFSDSYFHSGLRLEVYRHARSVWTILREDLFTWPILSILAVMTVTLGGTGLLVWLFERDKNPGQFGGHGLHGFSSGIWWASATMTTVGYGDKIPRTLGGRSVAVVLMFASLAITSVFTAAVTSVATVKSFQSMPQIDTRNLASLRLAVVADSAEEEYAVRNHLRIVACASDAEARQALRERRADAYFQSEAVLKFDHRHDPNTPYVLLPELIAPINFALAFPEGSPLRETVNRGLLRVLQEPAWSDIQYAYLGP